ncbi:MAG TPA: response regulator transcription factor [Candidatus Methylacidiphilales bacterium]|jgi:DNA-binding response OmpR family regulator|nr:response regulator transcription factor [Candidatus Methylacidiphilales bacterium]
MKILLLEDDAKIASFVAKGLREAGFVVDISSNGEEGSEMGRNNPYDAAIVDLMLPKLDGLGVIERWRTEQIKLPVLILSAKRSLDDRITGLQRGGDDYLTKPFSFAELLARLQALIRRSGSSSVVTSLTFADLKMDLLTREVWRGTSKIELQAREFLLLEYLLRNQNKVVSKTMILEHVWNYHFDPQTNVVDVLVCRLRNKIDRDFDPKLIHTLRGAGYSLRLP